VAHIRAIAILFDVGETDVNKATTERNSRANRVRDDNTRTASSRQQIDRELTRIVNNYPESLRSTLQSDLDLLNASGLDSFDGLLREVQSKNANKRTRAVSCWALGQLRNKGALNALLIAFEDSNKDVRWEAGKAIAYIGNNKALRPLIDALRRGRTDQRAAAAYALGALRNKGALKQLISTLEDKFEHPRVRAFAAEALANLADRRAVDALVVALSNRSPQVRFWSAFALGELGDRRAIPHLKKVVDSDAAVLRNWGPVSDEAARALTRLRAK